MLVYDEFGNEIRPDVTFTVILYGPSYPEGMAFEIRPGMKNALLVENLLPGKYHVAIVGAGAYRVKLPAPINLDANNPEGELIVKLYLPKITYAPATYHVGDTVE